MPLKYLTEQDNATLQHTTDMVFINTTGMEVASYLSDKAASVALVGTTRYPYERSLGPEIGKMSMQVRNNDDSSQSLSLLSGIFLSFV